MIQPSAYTITCDAFDCDPERWSPKSQPLTVTGDRRQAIAAAKSKGWRVAPGRGSSSWWCPLHAQAAGAA